MHSKHELKSLTLNRKLEVEHFINKMIHKLVILRLWDCCFTIIG